MPFPLLDLPNKLILEILRHSISELPVLLEISEISDLIHDSVIIIRYADEPSDLETNPLIKQPIKWLDAEDDKGAISQISSTSFVYFYTIYQSWPWRNDYWFSKNVPVYYCFRMYEPYDEHVFLQQDSEILDLTLYLHIDADMEMTGVIFEDCDLYPILRRMNSVFFVTSVTRCTLTASESSLLPQFQFNKSDYWKTLFEDCPSNVVSFFVSQSHRLDECDIELTSEFKGEKSLSNLQCDSLTHLILRGYSKLESSRLSNLKSLCLLPPPRNDSSDTDFPSLMNIDAPKLENFSLKIDHGFPHISDFRTGENPGIKLEMSCGSPDVNLPKELDQSTFEFLDQNLEGPPIMNWGKLPLSVVRMVNNAFPERLRWNQKYVNHSE